MYKIKQSDLYRVTLISNGDTNSARVRVETFSGLNLLCSMRLRSISGDLKWILDASQRLGDPAPVSLGKRVLNRLIKTIATRPAAGTAITIVE